MAQNYKLKQGVLLQAFSDASKTCTNDSPHFTDELAKWYLDNVPGVERFFAVIPGRANVPEKILGRPVRQPSPTIIVPPQPPVEIPPIATEFVKATEEKSEIEIVRGKLDDLKVRYHPKTGLAKLKILLEKNSS